MICIYRSHCAAEGPRVRACSFGWIHDVSPDWLQILGLRINAQHRKIMRRVCTDYAGWKVRYRIAGPVGDGHCRPLRRLGIWSGHGQQASNITGQRSAAISRQRLPKLMHQKSRHRQTCRRSQQN